MKLLRCLRIQRYKLLKAIHNLRFTPILRAMVVSDYKDTNFWKQFTTAATFIYFSVWLFQTTKIQTFESNSQQRDMRQSNLFCCFRLQRYKLLKAIHNRVMKGILLDSVVSDYKDTNFWKQFTTAVYVLPTSLRLFQTTKIQTFESNSQLILQRSNAIIGCFRLQRYKLLKAIHNGDVKRTKPISVVSDYKDTNFWKQFTTLKLRLLC